MGFNFLSDVVKKYAVHGTREVFLPSAVMTPWVRVSVEGAGGQVITVGNRSNAPNNFASVKSFQHGLGEGCGCQIEIFDEEGGAFEKFVNKLTRGVRPDPGNYLTVEWGWTTVDCGGPASVVSSQRHRLILLEVGMRHTAGGITFTLHGADPFLMMAMTVERRTYPNCHLADAIRQVCEPYPVAFLDARGEYQMQWDVRAADADEYLGPYQKTPGWAANGTNRKMVIANWLSQYRTINRLGMVVQFDDIRGRFVIREDPFSAVNRSQQPLDRYVGTYVVNGGATSPVLDFDPSFKWNVSTAFNYTAAVSSGPFAGNQGLVRPGDVGKPDRPDLRHAGLSAVVTPNDQAAFSYGKNVGTEMGNAVAVNAEANRQRFCGVGEAVTAQLRIVGDPWFDDMVRVRGRLLALITLNPNHVRGAGSQARWLSDPVANPILTQKEWMINGVSHEISDGSYTTTFQVFLPPQSYGTS